MPRRLPKSEPWPTLQIFGELEAVEGIRFLEDEISADETLLQRLAGYRTNPIGYSRDILGIEPWKGRNQPGQYELLHDIGESARLQMAGEPTERFFRVEAGHGVGKTVIAAVIANWFFDAFQPSITMTTAPTKDQVEALLWKNIKTFRPHWLPGRVLPGSPRMEKAPNHFAFGRTTSDAGGRGSERLQGQHDRYLLFIVDEAEGVNDFVFDAIDAMTTGGEVIIVLLIGNPKTRNSRFHKIGKRSGVRNYRFSVLDFPNVLDGKNTITGGTAREWVDERIERWCESVDDHDDENYTFTVPWEVRTLDNAWPAGTIFLPNAEFMFRIMGIAPANLSQKAFVSPGRYEKAKSNPRLGGEFHKLRIGVDCARFGSDQGTIYARHDGEVWRYRQVSQGDTDDYVQPIKNLILQKAHQGVTDIEIRVDGTGGFGSGPVDKLKKDEDIREAIAWHPPLLEGNCRYEVREVHFGKSASSPTEYKDIVTEMYAETAETLKGLRIGKVPNELEEDLTDRKYEYVNWKGRDVKKLEEKKKFKKDHNERSPDDGDGFVLCVAPDHIFKSPYADMPV